MINENNDLYCCVCGKLIPKDKQEYIIDNKTIACSETCDEQWRNV